MGRFAVRRDGTDIDLAAFGGKRVRELVRMLAADLGTVVSRDALIEALWGDHPPADPAANLNVLVNRARRALGGTGVIATAGNGYLMRADAGVVVDAELFERDAATAETAYERRDLLGAMSAVRTALARWGEPFPDDAYADWARTVRDRLERRHQDVLELGAEVATELGDARSAVTLAAEAVHASPLRERAHLLQIAALAAAGDRAAAMSAYFDLRRILADELGLDPSEAATALYDELLRGGTATRRTSVIHRRGHQEPTTFVGREEELDALGQLGERAPVAVIAGRSGMGKSRLMEAFADIADRLVLPARSLFPERELPWSLLRKVVDAAVSARPDVSAVLSDTTRRALDGVMIEADQGDSDLEWQSRRALVLTGATRVIAAAAPVLLVVDDLQWTDSSSLDALSLLIAAGDDVQVLLAYRPEETTDDSPVGRFLAEMRASNPIELSLRPLTGEAISGLVSSPDVARALAANTDGSPFAVVQVIRTLAAEGALRRLRSGGWTPAGESALDRVAELARAGQRDSVWQQFERRIGDQREVLAVLALLGRPAPARFLASVCGQDVDETTRVLQQLSRAGLVGHHPSGFAVDHDLIAETIRDRHEPVERARVHQRIAEALERSGAHHDELARHLAAAGDTAAAGAAYAAAAVGRLGRFADREAAQLAAEGLALEPDDEIRATLLEVRGETSARQRDLGAARADLRAALGLTAAPPVRARLLTRLAALTAGAEDMLRASELADLALVEAGDDRPARARAVYIRALIDMNLGEEERAAAGYDDALALFTAAGDADGVADILDARAMTTFSYGDINNGIPALHRVARLFADSGNLLRVVTPKSARGHALQMAGRPHEGLTETTSALQLARDLGYAEGEAMVHWHHAEALLACGRTDESVAVAEEGVALARRLDHRGWTCATLCALGLARHGAGDLDGATAALDECLDRSGDHLIAFIAWSHSRLAQILLDRNQVAEAADHVESALAITAAGLQQYEARLAQCEVAWARGDAGAKALIETALDSALRGGHKTSADRLAALRLLA